MDKKMRIEAVLLVCLLLVVSAGCAATQKNAKDKNKGADFVKSSDGLVIEFVKNYPGDSYVVSNTDEPISVVIDIRNKGTYPDKLMAQEDTAKVPEFERYLIDKYGADWVKGIRDAYGSVNVLQMASYKEAYEKYVKETFGGLAASFAGGKIFLSGFDGNIIKFDATSKELSALFLPAVSSVNPLGGLDTVEFDGKITASKVAVDSYDPTILATLCYPYFTKASPTVCIDPFPFDDRQQKVCSIGSQTLPSQGAPIAITRIDQEAATNNIKFKITIKNVGKWDVLKPGSDESNVNILDKCSLSADVAGKKPALDRKDFDKIKLEKVEIGSVDLFKNGKCGPFADGSTDIIRLFNGEGFIICSLDISSLGTIPSAYTTPLNIQLSYSYRSTASRHIKISKLTTIN